MCRICVICCSVGTQYGRRATWVGAGGDETFVKIDESLINIHTLHSSTVIANQSCIGPSLMFYMTITNVCLSLTPKSDADTELQHFDD